MVADTTSNHLLPAKKNFGRPIEWTKEVIDAERLAFEEWLSKPDNIFFQKFALERNYHPQTLSDLATKDKEFSLVLQKAKKIQEFKLVEGAMSGKFKEHFTKFLMTNHHNYVDRSESKVTQEGKVNVSITSYSNTNGIVTNSAREDDEIEIKPTFSSIEDQREVSEETK